MARTPKVIKPESEMTETEKAIAKFKAAVKEFESKQSGQNLSALVSSAEQYRAAVLAELS